MRLRVAIAAAAAVGIAIAAYLTAVHYAHTAPICTNGGCEKVQHSSYATLAASPLRCSACSRTSGSSPAQDCGGVGAALAGCVIALAGAAFSGYLLWAQIARIDAICVWCVGSDVVMACLVVLCTARLLTDPG